jgi:hypothetical protein
MARGAPAIFLSLAPDLTGTPALSSLHLSCKMSVQAASSLRDRMIKMLSCDSLEIYCKFGNGIDGVIDSGRQVEADMIVYQPLTQPHLRYSNA